MSAGLSFCGIDFETSCGDRSSVCAVGIVRVRDGSIIDRYESLVMPPTGAGSFRARNIAVHGITPEMVVAAPGWDAVFPEVIAFVGDEDLVAHNAPFDRSVMNHACSSFDIDWPPNAWYDTLGSARRLLTLGSYSLPFVSAALGLADFEHHDAVADAAQAALVAIELARRSGGSSLDALRVARTGVGGRNRSGMRRAGDFSGLGTATPLSGEFVAFTGTLTTTTRSEAISLVDHLGGTGQKGVTRQTTILVTGDFDPRTLRPGAQFSAKLQKAMDMAEQGHPIEVMSEIEFLDHVELSRGALESATREQRAQSHGGAWLPGYVVEQARNIPSGTPYNSWIRQALRHPEGRASKGDCCIRCGDQLGQDPFWRFAERHVCSASCAETLKRAAKREWHRAGINGPLAPDYAGLR